MLEDDGNAADEFTTMSSVIKSTLKWGEGVLGTENDNFQAEKVLTTKSAFVSTTFV